MHYSIMTAPGSIHQSTQEPAVPFGTAPTEPVAGGCSRLGLIGCGVAILLLGVAAVVFLFKAGDLFGWALSQFEIEITRALPEDCTESERQRLREGFAGAAEAVRSGEFDPSALQSLQGKLRESLLDEDQTLTREQVLELTMVLEEVAGQTPEEIPVEEEAPSPAIAALAAS
jgi:hypothetical protein